MQLALHDAAAKCGHVASQMHVRWPNRSPVCMPLRDFPPGCARPEQDAALDTPRLCGVPVAARLGLHGMVAAAAQGGHGSRAGAMHRHRITDVHGWRPASIQDLKVLSVFSHAKHLGTSRFVLYSDRGILVICMWVYMIVHGRSVS
jgi:hypothetical protein